MVLEPETSTADAVSFSNLRLRPTTLQALARMEIEDPTPIQAAALPPLLDGRDVVGQARTGSGKTLAFGIPAIEAVDPKRRAVQVLILTPTRELAVQVGGVLEQLAVGTGITTTLIFGGRALGPQRDELRRGVHVVVGTPGRVLDLLNQGALWLDQVRFLVLDEADEMLDRGFAPDVERIIARTANSRQTSLFSATVPDWVRQTAAKHLNDPVSVAVDPNPEDSAPIPHTAFDVADGNKLGALRDLLDHRGEGSIIVFGRTKHGVKKLARQLEQAGYPIAALQGNLSQNARDRVMADFRSGDVQILLATNVAARGLDVTSVEQVINFELPESPELLTHRVGRTGRMGRQGQAITLLGPEDGPKWRQLERGLGRRITRAPWRGAATVVNGAEQAKADEPSAPRERPTRPTARREMAPTRPRQRPERADDRQREPRRPTPSSGRLFAQRPAPQSQPVWDEDVRDAVATESPRSLMVDYGRDPHRPAWAQADSGAASEGRPAPRARGGRAGARRTGEAHEVTCSGCGQPARVPFQPDPTRPVYCADCFRTRPTTARRDAAPRRNRESCNGA